LKRVHLVLGLLISTALGCSGGSDVSGVWTVDLKSVEQWEDFKKEDDKMVKAMVLATYESMSIEINGNVLTMSGLGESTKCNISKFDVDNGVVCEDGETKFGLYKKDNALIMKDGSSNEKSVRLVRSTTKTKSAESALSTTSGSKSDPRVFVVGQWAGEPGWDCSEPIVITPDSVSLGKGQKIPLVIDSDGSVVLDKNGPFLTPDFKANTLIYGGSESGDSFALKRC
jgi:hypothetical protein